MAQSQPFTSVQIVERPALGDAEARLYLLAAAAKGDAAVYELSGDEFYEIGRNRQRAPVSTACSAGVSPYASACPARGAVNQ